MRSFVFALAVQVLSPQTADTLVDNVSPNMRNPDGRVPPDLLANYVADAPRLDGRLDDEAWRHAMRATGFRQIEPEDGSEPTELTEVFIVYDRSALYIGARLFDSDPQGIARRMGRRDSNTSSDMFWVNIDSYHDHRTTFRFSVNPAGVRGDGIATNDDSHGDSSWEPVWDVATRIDSLGWVAEMRIPFSQLRFSSADEQVWGINFARQIFRKNEHTRWSWVPNTEEGYTSHFGHLTGLRGIPAPRRLELLPYTVGTLDYLEGGDPRNPFTQNGAYDASVGLDLKYGLTSGLTLDATINPDFGQVEADPAVVNLSVFEIQFPERRPFFVEGADLFRFGAGSGGFVFGAPELFYSRRIGRAPTRPITVENGFVDYPIYSNIIGAAKLSGKTGGWSIGVLDALTAREYATVVDSDGPQTSEPVEPLTNFAVVSLRRDLRGGSSGIGILGTSVLRDLSDPVFSYLRRSAFTGGVDFFHRFGGNQFALNGSMSASSIRGDPLAITGAQLSSARFYQRPDQNYVSVDTTAASMTGYAGSIQLGKVAGNWTYGTDFYAYSPGFEINDAGFLNVADRVFWGLRLSRRWLNPGKVFRRFWASTTFAQGWNFGGANQFRQIYAGFGGQLLNYWDFNVGSNYSFTALSDKSTRGGPLMQSPQQFSLNGSIHSDGRKPFSVSLHSWYARNAYDGWGTNIGLGFGFRPAGALTFQVMPSYSKSHSIAFYVTQRQDSLATATYGGRYVFSQLIREGLDVTVRADLAITPNLSLQLWAQPYTTSGGYLGYKELAQPSTFDFFRYGVDGASTVDFDPESNTYTIDPDGPGPAESFSFLNPDFSFRSIRSNLVLRWEYSPGSTIFLVWNHNRSATSTEPNFGGFDEFGSLFGDPMANSFLVKINYWISL
ncbi:MAG: hypothetical protein AMS21_13260 [Gemmatimonas sp. SG8_38_2]|nr:MAG: hypothetical protein AMS21_13260 [Gemmatimonas sp. SG8_38_2]